MRKLMVAAAAAMVLAACSTSAPVRQVGPSTTEGVQLVNYAHEFDAVLAANAALSPAEQLAALDSHFAGRLPGFYADDRFGESAASVRAMRIAALAKWPQTRSAALRTADEFASRFDAALATFAAHMGPLPASRRVFLLMSLGEFDGGTRDFSGEEALYFGADAIADYYPGASTLPFLHHELFHLYHSPRMGECPQLWCSLWSEGLAVHVADQLNPGASDIELGLHLPDPLREGLAGREAEAICAIRSRLDDEEEASYLPIFTGAGAKLEGLPHRFGYLIGQRLAQRLGQNHTLAEMAQWHGADLRSRIDRGLAAMADCP